MADRSPRRIADSLAANVLLERRAQAAQLFDLVDLTLHYEVGEDDPYLITDDDIPGIGRIQVGGEGCPFVHEFLALEVAGILGVPKHVATSRISEALNLRFRHPELWDAVQTLSLDASRARRAAAMCADLPCEMAEEVSATWLRRQDGLSWTAAFDLLDELIRRADPEGAALIEEASLHGREVSVLKPRDGVTLVRAQMDTLDAHYLDATVDELADILATKPEYAELSKQQRRAKAMGLLAVPGYALALQQEALQQPLMSLGVEDAALRDAPCGRSSGTDYQVAEERTNVNVSKPPTEFLAAHDPHLVPGHKCGQVTVAPEKLQPKTTVVVHITADAVEGLDPVARIEGAGNITTKSLATLLADKQVVIRPVIDLAEVPDEDQYRPSPTMREAVRLTWEKEAFPFSTRRSRSSTTDLDHLVSYLWAGPPGQTSLRQLRPLSRGVHRAKTMGLWKMRNPRGHPDTVEWTSPLGFRYRVTPQGTYRLKTLTG